MYMYNFRAFFRGLDHLCQVKLNKPVQVSEGTPSSPKSPKPGHVHARKRTFLYRSLGFMSVGRIEEVLVSKTMNIYIYRSDAFPFIFLKIGFEDSKSCLITVLFPNTVAVLRARCCSFRVGAKSVWVKLWRTLNRKPWGMDRKWRWIKVRIFNWNSWRGKTFL